MGRRPKLKAVTSNGYDPDVLTSCVETIEKQDDLLTQYRIDYMNRCKAPHEAIAGAFELAKQKGIPLRAFKTVVKNHRLTRKIDANLARLEPDDADSYERIVADLGDFVNLPLGAAAAERARGSEQAGA